MLARTLKPPLEHRFVRRLDVHPVVTFILALHALFIPYVIMAEIYGVPIIFGDDSYRVKVPHLFAWPPSWTALGMSLLASLLIALTHYSQRQKKQIESDFEIHFSNSEDVLKVLNTVSPKNRRNRLTATIFGALLGFLTVYSLVVVQAADWEELLLTPRPWFMIVGMAIVVFSFRYIHFAFFEHGKLKEAMNIATLKSLHENTPQPIFVKIAMTRLLSWMLLIALSSIFLVRGEDLAVVTWPWIFVAFFTAGFGFISALDIGHKLMLRHKIDALSILNKKITALSDKEFFKPADHSKLTALLSLEGRVQNVPEWRISVPIAFKVLSFFLIPIMTWVSATIVREFVLSTLR